MSDYTDEELAQACEDFERTNGHRPGTTAVRERARALRAERERDGEREAAVSLALQLNVAQTECAELREIVEDLRKPSPMWQRIDELAQRTLKATGHDITAAVMAERDDLRRRLDATVAALRMLCGSAHSDEWLRKHAAEGGWMRVQAEDVARGREALTAAQPQADAPSVTQAELQTYPAVGRASGRCRFE